VIDFSLSSEVLRKGSGLRFRCETEQIRQHLVRALVLNEVFPAIKVAAALRSDDDDRESEMGGAKTEENHEVDGAC
jgi:hypothetical protein